MTPATILEHDDIKQPILEWALDYGITPAIIIGRLERGMSIADAITTPMFVGHAGQRLPIFSCKQVHRGQRKPTNRVQSKRTDRSAMTYTHNGKTLTLAQWALATGLSKNTIYGRLYAGWSIERALTLSDGRSADRAARHTINGETKTLKEWANHVGITYDGLMGRMRWPMRSPCRRAGARGRLSTLPLQRGPARGAPRKRRRI
ncbi:hypothetical protein GOB05_15210 [Sinorhizobium meliloti]|uniref:hypothetical protein n=1 Tax=Rhizobium meliloti TaxID=382 RepID=UPI000FDA2F7C|nr:hypothetical protein [Sinorhizobium meliloti]MDW9841316.1 hypothetical protein [Sinorhizobium meliloti]RVG08515.1 hypothetical protein CN230_21140 [Sinorhizobium meliloti]